MRQENLSGRTMDEQRMFFDDLRGSGKMISMPLSDFIEEHRKLLRILKERKPKELEKERKEQSAELKKYLKKDASKR